MFRGNASWERLKTHHFVKVGIPFFSAVFISCFGISQFVESWSKTQMRAKSVNADPVHHGMLQSNSRMSKEDMAAEMMKMSETVKVEDAYEIKRIPRQGETISISQRKELRSQLDSPKT